MQTNIDFPFVCYTFFNTEVVRRKSFCMFFFFAFGDGDVFEVDVDRRCSYAVC